MTQLVECNKWSVKGRLISLDMPRLWEILTELCVSTKPLFPKELDHIMWTVGTMDDKTTRTGDVSALPGIEAQVPVGSGFFELRLYHKEVTQNLQLELTPDCYLILLLDRFKNELTVTISTVGMNNANRVLEKILSAAPITTMRLPEHHEYLKTFVEKLLTEHVNYDNNVFLIMRYTDEPPFADILATLRNSCANDGLTLLRADDREYTADLWDNVMTYMYGCASAIAVFDEVNSREFNPNVAIEVGFMLALGKPVLLLKDQAIEAMPTDIVGKTYRPFNTYDLSSSIPPQVQKWIRDYNLGNVSDGA